MCAEPVTPDEGLPALWVWLQDVPECFTRGGALTPFLPLVAGDLSLANRIVMAPLTRSRAGTDGVPTEVMVDHYAQRSSVGLIISEGTFPSLAGKVFDGQPGLVTDAQLAGWRRSPTRCTPGEG